VAAEAESSGEAGAMARPRVGYLYQLAEVAVFLSLIVPSTILAQFAYQQERATFPLVAWATILRDLALVALIVFFLWRNREGPRAIGWRFRWVDLLIGIVLFFPVAYFASLLEVALHGEGFTIPTRPPTFLMPKTTADFVLAVVLVATVAISEETMFRGYLLLRLGNITRSLAFALVLSSLIFAMGHGYEGSAGMITVGFLGFVFGLIYLWRRSLVAPMVMHFMQDFAGIVLAPFLTGR
jgi:membrane protease YdiL (CAAX protease family)